jgi:hypothetical protein
MLVFFKPSPALSAYEREEAWLRNEEKQEAETAFVRARRKSLISALLRLNRQNSRRLLILGLPARSFEVPVEALSGIRRIDGSFSGSVPRLSRSMCLSWCKAYVRASAAEEADALPFEFSLDAGKLYLEGGNAELIRFEIAKARGRATVLAIIRPTSGACLGGCCADESAA